MLIRILFPFLFLKNILIKYDVGHISLHNLFFNLNGKIEELSYTFNAIISKCLNSKINS